MAPNQVSSAFVLVVCLIGATNAQVFGWGDCPDVTLKKDFNVDRYLGKWFEIARFPTSFEKDSTCVSANYSMKENGYIKIVNSGYFPDRGYVTVVGDAYSQEDEPAKLAAKFKWWTPRGKYWILDTDYNNYSLIHSCNSLFFGSVNFQINWILTRNAVLTETAIDDLVDRVSAFDIDVSHFEFTDHTNCPPKL